MLTVSKSVLLFCTLDLVQFVIILSWFKLCSYFANHVLLLFESKEEPFSDKTRDWENFCPAVFCFLCSLFFHFAIRIHYNTLQYSTNSKSCWLKTFDCVSKKGSWRGSCLKSQSSLLALEWKAVLQWDAHMPIPPSVRYEIDLLLLVSTDYLCVFPKETLNILLA